MHVGSGSGSGFGLSVGKVGHFQLNEHLGNKGKGPSGQSRVKSAGYTTPVAHIFDSLYQGLDLPQVDRVSTSAIVPTVTTGDPSTSNCLADGGEDFEPWQGAMQVDEVNRLEVGPLLPRSHDVGGRLTEEMQIAAMSCRLTEEPQTAAMSWEDRMETVDAVKHDLALVAQPLAMGSDEGLWQQSSNSASGHHAWFGETAIPSNSAVSEWVLERISEVSCLLGVSFEGHEAEAMRLFSAIEASRRPGSSGSGKTSSVAGRKGARELKNLRCSINYDHVDRMAGREVRKPRGGGPFLLK
ncbi:hypothetical protein CsSME_00038410 [Camellia sinensis var. sinensis]